jgi:hypothetical protein
VAAAVADDAGAVGPDDPLLAEADVEPEPAAEFELDDPPHAASSRTNDAIPVAAAHPLLRITSLQIRRDNSFLRPTHPGAFQGEPDTNAPGPSS